MPYLLWSVNASPFFGCLHCYVLSQWSVPDCKAFASELKSTVQPAILEQVRDGGSFRVLLLNSMTMVNFSLAGLQCPRVGSGKPAAAAAPAAGVCLLVGVLSACCVDTDVCTVATVVDVLCWYRCVHSSVWVGTSVDVGANVH